ncbi:MAG: decaprenyl-phosphate phosphoribosyltransferase [Candidatus Krumholzibacteriia bacterium]|nr:decaprenyl-phosphate phosphoribosyltransferase [bacterium]MCB9514828.1 decaprenyl-phosphate phosphoribosyltransferase [Candidatus Latescibacterota bacterium]
MLASQLAAFVAVLRPRQWTKNLIVLFGIVFARQTGQASLLARSVAACLVFCLLSGAIYLVNDRLDLEKDRIHPEKRRRPLPSGRLPLSWVPGGLVLVLALALGGAWWLGRNFFVLSVIFVLLNVLYSLWLKHQVILDAFGIALNFVLRAVAGVAVLAPHVVTAFGGASGPGSVLLSPWLLVCTFFGSLFLAFAKRRSELLELDEPGRHRPVLARYNGPLLDQLVGLSAGVVILAYALYTLWPSTVERYGAGFLLSNVFVTFGVMRYLYLAYGGGGAGDPAEVLLRDRPIQLSALGWMLFTLWTVGLGR